jgi:hypothetical protein
MTTSISVSPRSEPGDGSRLDWDAVVDVHGSLDERTKAAGAERRRLCFSLKGFVRIITYAEYLSSIRVSARVRCCFSVAGSGTQGFVRVHSAFDRSVV